MTAKQAKRLKPGDKVIPKYDAFEIGKYGRPLEKTVNHVWYDKFGCEYLIHTDDGHVRGHKYMKLATKG